MVFGSSFPASSRLSQIRRGPMSEGGGPITHSPFFLQSFFCCSVRPAQPEFETPPPGKIPGKPPGGIAPGPKPPPPGGPAKTPGPPPAPPPDQPIDVWGGSKIPNMASSYLYC